LISWNCAKFTGYSSLFEGEVEMAGGSGAEVGDFAFNPDVGVAFLDELADLGDEFADGPDAAGGLRPLKDEAELRRGWIGRGHSL
jgi:hypothetical protein